MKWKSSWILMMGIFVFLGCGRIGFQVSVENAQDIEDFVDAEKAREEMGKLPEDVSKQDFEYRGETVPTVYYHPLIEDELNNCKSGKFSSLRGEKGVELMQVCSTTYSACAMQGSCQISRGADVRSFNYRGMSGGQYVFFEIQAGGCVYGYGVQSSCLDPFFTVAADLRYHKAGEVIYLPKAVGVVLPDGSRHRGFFIVRDSGGAIKGAHRFDFFTGNLTWNDSRNPFYALQLSDPKRRFAYFRVSGETARKILEGRGFPGLP